MRPREIIWLALAIGLVVMVAIRAPRVPAEWQNRVPVCPPWSQPTVDRTCR